MRGSLNITAAQYQELADDEMQSDYVRDEFARLAHRAADREELHKRISAEARRAGLTAEWQQVTLRKLRWLHGLQFELAAWKGAKRLPLWISDVESRATSEVRGMWTRLARARREAEAGDASQRRWLDDHAALIAAVESAAQ